MAPSGVADMSKMHDRALQDCERPPKLSSKDARESDRWSISAGTGPDRSIGPPFAKAETMSVTATMIAKRNMVLPVISRQPAVMPISLVSIDFAQTPALNDCAECELKT
jgi:hypothetical protein